MIQPINIPWNEFPKSEAVSEGMIPLSPKCDKVTCEYLPDVVYQTRGETELHLQLLIPCEEFCPPEGVPLIVLIPGSAFHKQEVKRWLFQGMLLAVRGFAVAMTEYRGSEEAPFPAQMLDAKAAIRFLKRHAREYRANPEKIVVMGDSSGGHTALMAGLTCGISALEEEEPLCGGSVRGVIDSYGPTDISKMNDELSVQDHVSPDSPEGYLIGRKNVLEHPELAGPTVVMNYLGDGRPLPPVLIFHGSNDPLVAFSQSCMLHDKLREVGADVTFYQILGAHHGGREFWSEDVLSIVEQFIRRVTA